MPRVACDFHRILETRSYFQSGLGTPDCGALPLVPGLRCTRHPSVHPSNGNSTLVDCRIALEWFLVLFGNWWRELCLWKNGFCPCEWFVVQQARLSSRRGIPKAFQQTMSQVQDHRDWMAGDRLMQFTLNTCHSSQQHVASFHQSKVDSSVSSTFAFSSLSRCCDLHVHVVASQYGDCSDQLFPKCNAVAAQFSKLFLPTTFLLRSVPTSCSRTPLLPSKLKCCLGTSFHRPGAPSLATHSWFVPFCMPQVVVFHAEVFGVWLSVVLHQYRCDVAEPEASFPALPVAHTLKLTTSSRIALRHPLTRG